MDIRGMVHRELENDGYRCEDGKWIKKRNEEVELDFKEIKWVNGKRIITYENGKVNGNVSDIC